MVQQADHMRNNFYILKCRTIDKGVEKNAKIYSQAAPKSPTVTSLPGYLQASYLDERPANRFSPYSLYREGDGGARGN